MGVALVTQCHTHLATKDEVDTVLAIEGRCINYLAVATKQSASVIKWIDKCVVAHVKDIKQFSTTVKKFNKALEYKANSYLKN